LRNQTICKIVESGIDLDELLRELTLDTTGAIVIFTGLVRGVTRRAKKIETVHLEYEAYHPMAEKMMFQIADEIRVRWPEVRTVAIIQRIGKLYPGTPSVTVACSSAHRDTGVFEAARYGIDRLKEIVPIWKKESTADGESWIEGDYFPKPGD
jgi:molybdopterin synthase catalytic subunit